MAALLTASCGSTEPAAGQVWQLSFGSGSCGTPSVPPLRLITPEDPAPPWAGRMSTLTCTRPDCDPRLPKGRSTVDLVTSTSNPGESLRIRGIVLWGHGTEVLVDVYRSDKVEPTCEGLYSLSTGLTSTSGGSFSTPADAGTTD
jgi:hypothetical protein